MNINNITNSSFVNDNQENQGNNFISYFISPISNVSPYISITLNTVCNFIKADALKEVTDGCRNGTNQKTKHLPYITPSGTFTSRSDAALESYSGYICMDLDHLDDVSIESVRDRITEDPFLKPVLVFISPSNNGIKVYIKINGGTAENHLKHWLAISNYIEEKYQILADQSCKDISRPCFLCHDKNAYFNELGSIDSIDLLKYNYFKESPKTQEVKSTNSFASQTQLKPIDQLLRLPIVHERAVLGLINSGGQMAGESWTRPGKSIEMGISAKFNVDTDGLYKFTCFSSNWAPFEIKGYNDLQVISLLEFDGDFMRCFKDLSKQYLSGISVSKKINEDYFETRTFAQVVEDGRKEPKRRKIGGAFLYENTNTYLFSRTNYGKSLLAFQFAYAMATGTSFADCSALENKCKPMKVLLVDLELEAHDIFERHDAALKNMAPEHIKNFIYLHERSNVKPVFNFELLEKIEEKATSEKVNFIIIDNISKLLPDLLKAEAVSRVIETLKRIRQNLNAGFLVIGHTIKDDPRIAISPTSYYGSAMLQNFFTELFYLDMTKDERFFLCHSKTKHKEAYKKDVPILTRSDNSAVGLGFTYECLQSLSEVQLPLFLKNTNGANKRNLSKYKDDLAKMEKAGMSRVTIAEICNVDRSTISRILNT
jgi:VirE N-terminal domain/AAA domain